MKKSDIKILLVLAGVIAVALSIFLYARPKKEEIDSLNAQTAQLTAQYNDLQSKVDKEDEIKAETEQYNKDFEDVLKDYPADLNQESTVMFLKGVEDENEFSHENVTLPTDTEYYVLGSGAVSGDASVSTEPAVSTDASASSGSDDQYIVIKDAYEVDYKGTYEGLKSYLAYIADYKYRMTISEIEINYEANAEDPTKVINGNLVLNGYAISGPDRTPDEPNVNVPEGKKNIFADGNTATSSSKASTSYDADGAAEIITNHDLVVLLENAGNDTNSGIIIAASEADSSSYVTSSENAVSDLNVDVYEKDGKNYVSYAIGSNKFEKEVTSNDVKVYVKSSARVNADDTNGVNVKLTNSTTLPVYFKVVDDDASNPRFVLGETSGGVKVY